MKIIIAIASMFLAGCATTKVPMVTPVEVLIPVLEKCVTELPARPNFVSNDDLVQMPDELFVDALHLYRLQSLIYIAELEATLAACK